MIGRYQRWRSHRQAMKEALEFHRDHDPEENAESQLPPGEQVELHSIWVAEMYTPSLVGPLFSGLHDLGWDTGASIAIEDLDVTKWVTESRASAFGGSWSNLGHLARPGDTTYPGVRRAPLPAGVKYATATMHSPVPSVTACVVKFVLDDYQRNSIQAVLERDFQTRITKLGGRTRIETPKNLKQDALKAARTGARDVCAQWFRDHLPGTFAQGLAGERFPTLELLTTTQARPFRMERKNSQYYTWALNIEWEVDAWVLPDYSELVLQMPHSSFDDVTALVLTGNKSDLLADPARFAGYGDDDERLARWLSHRVDGNLVMLGLHHLLVGHQEDLGELRDAVRAETMSAPDAMERLTNIRSALLATSADAEIAATEIKATYELDRWRQNNATDFEPLWEERKQEQESWIETFRSSMLMLATNVLSTQRQVRDMLAAEGSIVGGITNLRIQRALVWLTVVMAVLTVVAVGIAAAQVWLVVTT